jgi:signal transduction histidine kinase
MNLIEEERQGRWEAFREVFAAPTEASAEARVGFERRGRWLTARAVQVTAVITFLLSLLALPTDFFIFPPGSPHLKSLLLWRAIFAAVCVAGFLLIAYLPAARERPAAVAILAFNAVMGASGWLMGSVVGLESPLFYGVYTAPLLTVLLVVRLPTRTVATFTLVAFYLASFFLTQPEALSHPQIGVPFVWLVASSATSIVVGHVVYLLLRLSFLQRRGLARATDELREMSKALKDKVAEQSRLLFELARNLASAQETERRRIAREVHDELGQVVTGLRIELEMIEQRIARETGAAAGTVEGFASAYGLLGEVHESLTRVVNALRPTLLDERGLAAAIEWLAGQFDGRSGFVCRALIDVNEDELTREQAIGLYRIVQEALTNVARHAAAKVATVTLNANAGRLLLRVRDDGRGGAMIAPREQGGFGLIGIRERSRMMGGDCEVRSHLGEGTEIVVTLPRVGTNGVERWA